MTNSAAAHRYADPEFHVPAPTETIRVQLRHRSVRKFLPQALGDEDLSTIVAAAQSAATSSNLQPWSVVAIRSDSGKARIAALLNDQRFVHDAGVFLVWLADLGRAHRLARRHDATLDGAAYLDVTLTAFLDAALAAQNAVVAAESLGLGTVYVGGVRNRPEEIARALELPAHTFAVFGLAVGVPDPTEQADVKPRLPQGSVLHHETYSPDAADEHVDVYDKRLLDYNLRFGGSGGWTERVLARLADRASLHGRETMRDSLETLGFPSV